MVWVQYVSHFQQAKRLDCSRSLKGFCRAAGFLYLIQVHQGGEYVPCTTRKDLAAQDVVFQSGGSLAFHHPLQRMLPVLRDGTDFFDNPGC